MPDKGRKEKALAVKGGWDGGLGTADMPSGGSEENLLLLVEPQSVPEECNRFLPRPGAVAALEISHRMRAQAC